MKNVYASVKAGGMDVHYKFTTVTMRDARGKIVRRERLDHRDREALRQKLSRWPADARLVMEASFGWGWVADVMRELGLKPELANCYKLEQMRKARGLAKTNKKDADLLSLLPYETDSWWRVWMAPPEVRNRREWMRYRSSLVKVQTQTKNRISAVLHRHGIVHGFSDLFGAGGRGFLAEVCVQGGTKDVALPDGALAGLRGLLGLLGHVRGQLARIADDTGEEPKRTPVGRRLGRRGNRTLKWAFVEAAHGAVRRGGKWRRCFDSVTEGGTKNVNRGYIKVARELVKVVYVVWKKEANYTDSPPPRPGRLAQAPRRRRSALEQAKEFLGDTRSGTGQPCRPMAVVR